jgi:hypothetical protein
MKTFQTLFIAFMFISFSHSRAIYRVYAADATIDRISLNGVNFDAVNNAPKISLIYLRAGYITENDNQNTWTVHSFNCVVTYKNIDLTTLVTIPANTADNAKPNEWADGMVGCKAVADVVLNEEENISQIMSREEFFGNGNAQQLVDTFPIEAYAADASTQDFQFSITIDNPYLVTLKRANNGHNGLDFYIGLFFRFNFRNSLYYEILKDDTLSAYGLVPLNAIPQNIRRQVQAEQQAFQDYIKQSDDPDSDKDEEAYISVLLLTQEEKANANGDDDGQVRRKLLNLV